MFSVETPIYDAKSIANFFIKTAEEENRQLTPLELMKLVYLAHGWYLGLTGRPLLNEAPEALETGPIIPTLYAALTVYGTGTVTRTFADHAAPEEPSVKRFLKDMWEIYGKFSSDDLTALTSGPDTPWSETWMQNRETYPKGIDIPEASIQQYYAKLNASLNANARAPEPQPATAAAARE